MEAPKCINSINKEKEFEIISNKKNQFNIKFINQGTDLIIKGFYNNEIQIKEYEDKFSIEKIKENKVFNYYETIDEILEELFPLINEQKVKLIEETNKIILIIELPFNKIKEIIFSLNEKEKNDKERLSDLYKIIINQKKEIDNLKNENVQIKSQMETILLKFKELETKFNNKIEKDKKKDSNKIDSKIITYPNNDIDFLNERLLSGKNSKKNIKYNLIYRASRDGDYTTKFQEKCKGHFHQLVCIKTTDLNIFGGYTDIGFQSRAGGIYNDDEAFVFSFDKQKIYNIKKGKEAIYDKSDHGPFFGNYNDGYCIFTAQNQNLLKCTCQIYANSPFDGFTSNYELNQGKSEFFIQELEVFEVLFS